MLEANIPIVGSFGRCCARAACDHTTAVPQIDMKKHPHGGLLCLLGPYGDFFIDVLAEILTRYPDVDAKPAGRWSSYRERNRSGG